MMDWNEFQKWCGALVAWREARGEIVSTGRDGLRGVLHVIDNRAKKHNKSWAEVIYQPWQFSSMTASLDPQLSKVPVRPDPAFETCWDVADAVFSGRDFDITQGATHYFADSIAMPAWAKDMTATAKIGHHSFYREEANA